MRLNNDDIFKKKPKCSSTELQDYVQLNAENKYCNTCKTLLMHFTADDEQDNSWYCSGCNTHTSEYD